MKKLSYKEHYELILKAKRTNPYLYIKTYKEAKNQLMPEKFIELQGLLSNVA